MIEPETTAAAGNANIAEQAPPKPAAGDVWRLVLSDMEDRRRHGIEKYGTPLQVGSGRDPLIDAYQEALDLCVYLRQEIEKRKEAAAEDDPEPIAAGDYRYYGNQT